MVAEAAKNQETEWGLNLYLPWGILYTSIQAYTHSHNSITAAEASSLMISSKGHKDHEDCPTQQKNSHKLPDKKGHLISSLKKANENWYNTMEWKQLQNKNYGQIPRGQGCKSHIQGS